MIPETDQITHYICKRKTKMYDEHITTETLLEIAGQTKDEVLEMLKVIEEKEKDESN